MDGAFAMTISASDSTIAWVRIGMIAGILADLVYATFFIVPWPLSLAVFVALSFGVLLMVAAVGLRAFLGLHRPGIVPDLAALFTIVGAALVDAMLVVQLAVRNPPVGADADAAVEAAREIGDRVHYGLDVGWDVFIALGTLLFAWAALRHPRLGWWIGIPGIAVAVALLAFNLASFPVPPAGAGSIDVGPLVGLWYLVVSIRVLTSMRWVRERAGEAVVRYPAG
jgi:hypothetical protein